MPVLDYEPPTAKPPKRSPVCFWLLLIMMCAVTIALVSVIIDAGLAEYGGKFMAVGLLFGGTPCVFVISALCVARFWGRRR